MVFSSRITLIAALALAAFQAQAVNVTVAYQTSAEPAKVAQADNTFAKASGATVDWRKFDSGASIVRALASGDVQIRSAGSEEEHHQTAGPDRQTHRRAIYLHHPLQPAVGAEALGD